VVPGRDPEGGIQDPAGKLAQEFAEAMLEEGIYVIGFSFPVVPKGQARIRVQLSAAHERDHIERALDAFRRVGKRLEVIS
jgi:glycine C-acetyltransferase